MDWTGRWVLLGITVAVVTGGLACQRDVPRRKYNTFEGRVLEIDLAKKRVRVEIERDGRTNTAWGQFDDKTEIVINGRAATPADVQVGDNVKVIWYKQGEGEDRRLMASKVEITRTGEWVTTSVPATTAPGSP